jgi:uroporphyrinogen-III synthase
MGFFLTNTIIAMLSSDAFVALFVSSASRINLIFRRSDSHFAHRPISEKKAVAAISPVLALVEFFRAFY